MLDEARQVAHDEAVRAGADPAGVEIVALEELPLAYLTTPAVRIRAKAAGPLESHTKEENTVLTADHPNRPRRGLTAAVLVAVLALAASACGSTSKPAGASSGGSTRSTRRSPTARSRR